IYTPTIWPILLREEQVRDFQPQLGRPGAEALEPDGALVEAVQRVLPGEADAAVHLDRALARSDRGLGRERLGRGGGDRRALVLLGAAPRRPVDERTCELDVGVRLRERMGDGLVRADRLAELRAGLRVLDTEVECALRDAQRLGCGGRTEARRLLDRRQRARRVDS